MRWALWCALVPACGPAPASEPLPVRPPVAPAPADQEPTAFPRSPGERAFERMALPELELSIPLPNASGWRRAKEPGSFVVLEHEATRSRLVLRVWAESEVLTRSECEERARLLRELPSVEEPLAEMPVGAPRGFDTHAALGVIASPQGPLEGYLVAFGASARRCFAFAYTTEEAGPAGVDALGARLAVIEGVTLRGIRLARELP